MRLLAFLSAIGAALAVPCLQSELLGEWTFFASDCTTATPSAEWVIRLAPPNKAYHWVKSTHGGYEEHPSEGYFSTVGAPDGMSISVGGSTFTTFFTTEGKCKGAMNISGTVRTDATGEQRGCFRAHRSEVASQCADQECHSAFATAPVADADAAAVGVRFTRRLRLGSNVPPARRVLQPSAALLEDELLAPRDSTEAAAEYDMALAAAAINATAGVLWRAAAPTSLEPWLGLLAPSPQQPKGAPPPLGLRNGTAADVPAADLPAAVDWRTRDGGGYLSPPPLVAQLAASALPAACLPHLSHVLAALTAVEARIRIGSSRTQSETLAVVEALACSAKRGGNAPDTAACTRPTSAFIVAQYGLEFGFERASCLGAARASSGVGANESVGAWCASIDRCAASPKRRVRRVRYVGGYLGNASEESIMRELHEHGPVAVGLYADADLALYAGGVYHPLRASYWTRLLGRTRPLYAVDRCHSGCVPPSSLEWQQTNLGASLVGYGADEQPDGTVAPYWILQLPWGRAWGEGGYARVLRSEAAIFDAVAIEPMV